MLAVVRRSRFFLTSRLRFFATEDVEEVVAIKNEKSVLREVIQEMRHDTEFAKSPNFRMEVFNHPPSPAVCHPSPSTFEDFFELRKWVPMKVNTSEHRLITQALSYPLTLGYLLKMTASLLPTSLRRLNVCCVGARAESSLLMPWWKEMIMFNSLAPEVNILMVGPETMNARKERASVSFAREHISLRNNATTTESSSASSPLSTRASSYSPSSSVLSPFYQGTPPKVQNVVVKKSPSRALFHQRTDAPSMLKKAHVFVLFNPGLSYPWHNEGWGESLDLILSSKKPVLFSSPSREDMQRDIHFLKKRYPSSSLRWIVKQMPNPFKSGRRSLTQIKEVFEVVVANQMIFGVQMV